MRYIIFATLLGLFVFCGYKHFTDEDTEKKVRKCLLLGKYQTGKFNDQFYIIIQVERITKEISVEPQTYVRYEKGDTCYFSLDNYDLNKSTGVDYGFYMFILGIILIIYGGMLFL